MHNELYEWGKQCSLLDSLSSKGSWCCIWLYTQRMTEVVVSGVKKELERETLPTLKPRRTRQFLRQVGMII